MILSNPRTIKEKLLLKEIEEIAKKYDGLIVYLFHESTDIGIKIGRHKGNIISIGKKIEGALNLKDKSELINYLNSERAIEKTKEAYNKHWQEYIKYSQFNENQYSIMKFISKLKGKTILDVGCGDGKDMMEFRNNNFKVAGIDISEKMAEISNAAVMDMRKITLKGKFSGIWCNMSFHHLPKTMALPTLFGFKKLLSKKGICYISLPIGNKEGFRRHKELGNSLAYVSEYTRNEFEKLLLENDFEILSSEENSSVLEVYFR